ncbi:unnamed protein product [Bathycoccus prasinos]
MKRAMSNLKCYQKTGRVHRSKSADIIAQDDAECIVLQRYEDAPNHNFILGELNKFKALEDQDVLVNKLIFLKSKEARLKENREKTRYRECCDDVFSSLGYSLGTLIHDGFLVEDLSVRDEDLREAEKYTEEATGYSIQCVRKPLTDFNREEVFGSDDEIEENGDTLGVDRENADALKWMTDEGHAFVRNGKEVWWYCPENGVYSQDLMGL